MVERARIGKAQIAALQPDSTVWDTAVIGFGARRQRSAAVTYFLMYRSREGVQRRLTIGRHGPLTPDRARDKAKALLGRVVDGVDPAKERAAEKVAADVSQLCDAYLADARAGRLLTARRTAKKASTLATDAGRIERHIKPLLGTRKVAAVTRDDVERWLHDVADGKTAVRQKTGKLRGVANVRGGKGTATRTLALLGHIFTYAERKGMRSDNPSRGVVPFAYNKRERRLADAEYGQLAAGLARDDLWPPAVAAARFLLLTGWRRGEAVGLRWAEVDLDRRTARLSDTKTGRSIRPLSNQACELILAQAKVGEYVFMASRGTGAMTGFPSFWRRIAKAGALPPDVTPHVLRHWTALELPPLLDARRQFVLAQLRVLRTDLFDQVGRVVLPLRGSLRARQSAYLPGIRLALRVLDFEFLALTSVGTGKIPDDVRDVHEGLERRV